MARGGQQGDPTDWVTRGDFTRCGPFGDQYCCNDVCCIVGACCNDDRVCEFGSPYCSGCIIGGRYFRPFERNPNNPCQVCDVSKSTSEWSNARNQQSCGQMVDDDGVYRYYATDAFPYLPFCYHGMTDAAAGTFTGDPPAG